MHKNDLKEKLLQTGIIVNNEWLDKYVNLIINNAQTEKIKFKTQVHHIIPRCYYKHNNIPIDESSENKVILLYDKHILAHLYLANATNDAWFMHRNMKAVDHVIGNKNYKLSDTYVIESDLIKNSELYLNTYAKTKEYWSKTCNLHDPNSQSKEQRRLNGLQNTGRKYINKDGVVKAVFEDEYNKLIAEGWQKGNINNTKKNLGCKHMYKDDIQLFVRPEDIDKRLSEGFVFGDKPGSNSHGHKCPNRRGISAPNSIKVKCIETGVIYDSIAKASKATGDNVSYIIGKLRQNKPYKGPNSKSKFTWAII